MKYRTNNVFIVVISLLMIALIGCDGGEKEAADNVKVEAEGNDVSGGDLNVALSAQPKNLDTQLITNQVIREISRNIYESLVALDAEYQVVPMLAESVDVSEDFKNYTFHLREGVMFHTGQEMKAEDVVASMNRWIDLYPNAENMIGGSEFEAEDDYTVVINLAEPSSDLLIGIAGAKQMAVIMPADIAEATGGNVLEEYVGTGPFEFVEWKQDQFIQLGKFEEYEPVDTKASGMAGKKEALVDNVYYHFVPDNSTRIAGIQTSEYHVAEKLSYDDYDMLESDSNVETYVDHYASGTFVYNKKEGAFTDINMRKAVNAAMDADEILIGTFSNDIFYDRTSSYIYEQQVDWFSEEGQESYSQKDQDLAKEYLEKADYNGEEITLVTTRDYEYMYDMSVIFQQQLEEVGININLEVYDFATLDELEQDPAEWDFAPIVFTPVTSPVDLLYLSETWRGWNDDEEILDLLSQISRSISQDEKKELWDKAQARSWEYLPITKVGDFNDFIASTTDIEGLTLYQGLILWNTSITE